jgi:hypothetical protein
VIGKETKAVGDWLTGYEIIHLLGEGRRGRGTPKNELPPVKTNYKQLREYEDWGLIPRSVDDRWPENSLAYLREANRLASRTRTLSRRVILRYLDEPESIAPDKLRRALIDLATRMKSQAPVKKMGRIKAALAWQSRATLSPGTLDQSARPPRKWSTPAQSEWPGLLGRVGPEVIKTRAEFLSHLDTVLLNFTDPEKFPGRPGQAVIHETPREERFLLLTVWDTANFVSTRKEQATDEK